MRIGTQSAVIDRVYGPQQTLTTLKAAGFDTVDFSLEDERKLSVHSSALKQYFENLGSFAKDLGMEIGQTHAPFYNIDRQMARYDEILELQKKAIAATAYLGCKYIIIHPLRTKDRLYNEGVEQTKQLNWKYYSALIPTLEEYDVYLGVENMFAQDPETKVICPTVCTTAEEMVDFIDSFGDRFVACLDIGHVNLIHQEGFEHVNLSHMIKTLGHRLKTLHLHDNDGMNDLHLPPYMGTVDWQVVMNALKEIGYSGNLSLEADNFMGYIKPEAFENAEKIMYATAKRLYDMLVQEET